MIDCCLHCKGLGFYRDCLSGGESYCTCPVGQELKAEDSYLEYETMMGVTQQEVDDEIKFSPIWEEADRLAEEEAQSEYLEAVAEAMYPDSHDRYECRDLQSKEIVDDQAPEPKNEDECQY